MQHMYLTLCLSAQKGDFEAWYINSCLAQGVFLETDILSATAVHKFTCAAVMAEMILFIFFNLAFFVLMLLHVSG